MAHKFEKSGKLKVLTDDELVAADAHSDVIVLDQGMLEDGRPYWLYIAVKPSKYKEFLLISSQRKPKRFRDYGIILRHGFDKQVPSAVKEEMKQQYGCDENYMATLAKSVKAAQIAFLKNQEIQRIGDIVSMLKMKQDA